MENDKRTDFEKSGEEKESGLMGEFLGMMKQNKKYWLIPLIAILALFGVLIILGSTAAAPFIYTLF
jgi:ABC-type microcin C transport system permease subunit YejE